MEEGEGGCWMGEGDVCAGLVEERWEEVGGGGWGEGLCDEGLVCTYEVYDR